MLGTFRNWVDVIGRVLAADGIDLRAELAARQAADMLARDLHAERLDRATTRAIWGVVEEQSPDPVFGLTLARSVDYLDFEELGVALVATGSAEAVLGRLARYIGLLSDDVSVTVTTGERMVEIGIEHHQTHWRVEEFIAALIMRLLRARFDWTLPAALVTFAFENAAGEAAYRRYFRSDVILGAAGTRLVLDRMVMARTTTPDTGRLTGRLDQLLRDRADELHADISTTAAVHQVLRATFGRDRPDVDLVAARLHLSSRTLQRRLRQEHTTFTAELDRARRASAAEWLDEGRLSLTEIAYLLGFTRLSSFSRVRRRWSLDDRS